jgi:SAM-dependent methyltransferase
MSDDVSDIAAYYNNDPQREHFRLERHQLEYDLTWRYLNRYLPMQGSILEIGAATGRYTVDLARRGFTITAVDMSAALLEECRKNVVAAGRASQVQFVAADARDLSELSDTKFDAVLLMGPLYHLVDEADRTAALNQAFERLKAGGGIFSSFISRFGVLADLLRDNPEWIEDQKRAWSLLQSGRRPDGYPPGGFRGYFAGVNEIAPLHEAVGFETLVVAGVEPVISADDESYNSLQGSQRQLWMDLLYAISTEPSIMGVSRHLLYIGRKPR